MKLNLNMTCEIIDEYEYACKRITCKHLVLVTYHMVIL